MRAVVVSEYAPIEDTSIAEVAQPAPGPGEVLVEVAAVGIGFVDGLKVQGLYQTKDPLPFTPGTELSGRVSEVGQGVSGWSVGDRVFASVRSGALAEYCVVPAAALRRLPEGASYAEGAAMPINYLTALYAIADRAGAQPGETLLVLGASGGTGAAAIAIGKLLGLRVIAAASTEQKREFAAGLGADETIDSSAADWRDRFKGDGNGVDIVFDPVGGQLGEEAFRALGWRGRLLVIGFASGEIPSARYNIALLKGASLVGVDMAQLERREPELAAQRLAQLDAWLASGELKPVVGATFEFGEFQRAFAQLSGRSAQGKVVVVL